MELDALITLVSLLAFLVVALRGTVPVDIALVGVMTALLLLDILTPTEAFKGFSNPALIVIACFYIVSAAVKETGAIKWWVMKSLGTSKQASLLMPRIILPTAMISSVISNTPVVAIFIPQLQQWARRHNLSPSKIMMPLSFAAILGGTLSLIGTSTNIILLGLLEDADIKVPFKLFSPALIGIPLIIICTTYFILLGSRWLPNRKDVSDAVALVTHQLVGVRGATGYRPTLSPLLPLHVGKKSSHLFHILGLTARRDEQLSKDGDRGPHIHITHKLINRLGAGIGIVIGIHHPSIIKQPRGNIGTGKGRKPLLRDETDKGLILNG